MTEDEDRPCDNAECVRRKQQLAVTYIRLQTLIINRLAWECCVDSSRYKYNLSSPWIHEGYAYASDGRMILRTDYFHVNFGDELDGLRRPAAEKVSAIFAELEAVPKEAWPKKGLPADVVALIRKYRLSVETGEKPWGLLILQGEDGSEVVVEAEYMYRIMDMPCLQVLLRPDKKVFVRFDGGAAVIMQHTTTPADVRELYPELARAGVVPTKEAEE